MQAQSLCVVCGRNIVDHRDRRKLHSEANRQSLSALVEVLSQRGLQINRLLHAAAGSAVYLCKHPCFNDLRRLTKLREELQCLQKKIVNVFSRTHSIPLPGPSDEAEPSPKRPRLAEGRKLTYPSTSESPGVSVGQ